MGRPPAVIIIARHGARLDSVDTQWHLTSPTPYDPPLTYGGWRQSQALGARIASIIHAREAVTNAHTLGGLEEDMRRIEIDGHFAGHKRRASPSNRAKRRKHRVVIHTSPFQRCIQTSIAISAGIAQHQAPVHPSTHQSHSKPHVMHSGSPHIRAMDGWNSPYLSAITEPEDQGRPRRKRASHRTLLRVDAFLGEWLSPEYFDKITHPPESKMMLASSKAYLLHHEDPINLTYTFNRTETERGNFPGGWSSGNALSSKTMHSDDDDDDKPLKDLSTPSQPPPRLGRAVSHSLGSSPNRSDLTLIKRAERSPTPENTTYVPPIPSYAISPSQPIPSGYVSHARDACIKMDTLWDSLRPPLEWGSGGEYGEEWSALHKRMRRGLNEMITWYRSHDNFETLNPIKDDLSEGQNSGGEDQEDYDDETDTVLVLVTHGAGCNALIGALTSQPVLLDVGMASLTMAVRKTVDYKRVSSPQNEEAPVSPAAPSRRRYSLIDTGISEDYEIKLTASMDHVRTGSPFLAGPPPQRTPNLPVREKSPYRYERPGFLNSHHPKASPTKEYFDPDHAVNNRGSLRKSATTVVRSSSGLWSMPVSKQVDDAVEGESRYPNLQTGHLDPVQARKLNNVSERAEVDRHERLNGSTNSGRTSPGILDSANQGHSIVPNGLWGAPPQALGTERDQGAKRRWTLSQAS